MSQILTRLCSSPMARLSLRVRYRNGIDHSAGQIFGSDFEQGIAAAALVWVHEDSLVHWKKESLRLLGESSGSLRTSRQVAEFAKGVHLVLRVHVQSLFRFSVYCRTGTALGFLVFSMEDRVRV